MIKNIQANVSSFQQDIWNPPRVSELPQTSEQQFEELELPNGWVFAAQEQYPVMTLVGLGRARVNIRTFVYAISATEALIQCEDPYLLAYLHRQPKVKFQLVLFENKLVGLQGQIIYIDLSRKLCRIRLLNPNKSYLQALGLHLLRYGLVKQPKQLLEKGLQIPSLEPYFEYRLLRDQQELEPVIALRTRAYTQAGKYSKDAPMTDEYDGAALILTASLFGRVIASLRILVHAPEECWEYDNYITWGEGLPPREESVEVTRVCVDPDYWKTRVLVGLFQRTALVLLLAQRRYLVGSAPNKLLPLYQKIGCVPTSYKFSPAQLNFQEDTMFYADTRQQTIGLNISPITWAILWKEPSRLFVETGTISKLSKEEANRFNLMQGIGPVLVWGIKNGLRWFGKQKRSK